MTHQVNLENSTEVECHRWSTEASDLGLSPGNWPEQLPTILGNKLPFLRDTKKVRDGDLLWVTYRQALGCISLRVFND